MAEHRIGIISDTHGLLRPTALRALEGSEQIIHAGDIGKPDIIEALRGIAPVTVVRGNTDRGGWAAAIPRTELIQVESTWIYVIHDLHELDIDPPAAGVSVVVSGHSHQPKAFEKGGVLYLNPGSAGPRRFTLPITVALLHVRNGRLSAERIDLEP